MARQKRVKPLEQWFKIPIYYNNKYYDGLNKYGLDKDFGRIENLMLIPQDVKKQLIKNAMDTIEGKEFNNIRVGINKYKYLSIFIDSD